MGKCPSEIEQLVNDYDKYNICTIY